MIVVSSRYSLCTRCRKFKTRGAFYKMRDGRCVRKYRIDSWCKCCRVRAQREYRQKVRSDPAALARYVEARRKAEARWREKHPDKVDAIRWAYYQRIKDDPERRALRAEAARMNYRIRAEKRGIVATPTRRKSRHYRKDLTPAERLDPAPFVAWLRETYPGSDFNDMARELGVHDRWLRGLYADEYQRVSLLVVDRAFTTLGRPDLLNDLYPLT